MAELFQWLNPPTPRSDSHKNFSLQCPYTIQQTDNENTQMYQVEVVTFIKQQILVTNLNGNV